VKAVIDCQPRRLNEGAGYPEGGGLFRGFVSTSPSWTPFECGIVKIRACRSRIKRMEATTRSIATCGWTSARGEGVRRGQKTPQAAAAPRPARRRAQESCTDTTRGQFAEWGMTRTRGPTAARPPVVHRGVQQTPTSSKAVSTIIAGLRNRTPRTRTRAEVRHPGATALTHVQHGEDQRWLCTSRNTILVDSRQLNPARACSEKTSRSSPPHQIDDFKADYRKRFPGPGHRANDRGT